MRSSSAQHHSKVAIRRWAETADAQRLLPEIDAIFFEASATKSFAGEAERQAFRERWLGRYLAREGEWAYLAMAGDGKVAGYLIGSVRDPVGGAGYSGNAYCKAFAALTSDYPAHLHVNLAPAHRNRGIGGRLIAAFALDAARAGAKGVHVVTAAGARNVGFYERNGFRPLALSKLGESELVLLGRRLAASETA